MDTRIWPGLPENLKILVEHIWNTHKNGGRGYQLKNPKLSTPANWMSNFPDKIIQIAGVFY